MSSSGSSIPTGSPRTRATARSSTACARPARLPEKADYRDWKKGWLAGYGTNTQREDQWHLPDGRTLHVVADSAAEGGVTYLYENVTERLALESRYNALIDVQRETLDTSARGRRGVRPERAPAPVQPRLRRHLAAEPARSSTASRISTRSSPLPACSMTTPEEWERIKAAVTAIVAERRRR